jgi:hypothetical protein
MSIKAWFDRIASSILKKILSGESPLLGIKYLPGLFITLGVVGKAGSYPAYTIII